MNWKHKVIVQMHIFSAGLLNICENDTVSERDTKVSNNQKHRALQLYHPITSDSIHGSLQSIQIFTEPKYYVTEK